MVRVQLAIGLQYLHVAFKIDVAAQPVNRLIGGDIERRARADAHARGGGLGRMRARTERRRADKLLVRERRAGHAQRQARDAMGPVPARQ
jgi:hypothetical protein